MESLLYPMHFIVRFHRQGMTKPFPLLVTESREHNQMLLIIMSEEIFYSYRPNKMQTHADTESAQYTEKKDSIKIY